MEHERLKHMKHVLMCAVESQLNNLDKVDTKELGEAIDMIKDIEEAIYYCTITKAMEGNGNEEEIKYSQGPGIYNYPSPGSSRNMMVDEDSNPHYEGKSPKSRVMYMESKEKHMDKAAQLRELEKYMQELSQDLIEMIDDSTPEEKQYLEKKLTALASKVGQMK